MEAVAVCYGWLLRVTRNSDAAHRLIEDGYSAELTADQEHFGASHKPAFGLKRQNVRVESRRRAAKTITAERPGYKTESSTGLLVMPPASAWQHIGSILSC